jgi:hypothetical protein
LTAWRIPAVTERAAVRVHAVEISTYPGPLSGDSRMRIVFKHHGRARATDVSLVARFKYGEMIGKRRQRSIPVMTLGDDDTQSLEFDAFRRCVSEGVFEQVRSGIVSMAFVAVADYTDVLGRRHRTRNEGVYRAKERVFEITRLEGS